MTSVHPAFDNRIFFKECLAFRDAGFETVLIAPHPMDEVVEGVQIRAIRTPTARLGRLVLSGFGVLRAALKEQGDAYHMHDPELIWVGVVLRLLRRPVVFDMHESLPRSLRTKHWIRPYVRRPLASLASFFERITLPWMHVVFAENSYVEDYPWHQSSITVLNMPDLKNIEGLSGHPKGNFSVGYIGRIHEDRGALSTLEALIELKKKGIFVEVDYVGAGDSRLLEKIEGIASEKGLAVRLHGFQKSLDGLTIIASNDVGLALLAPNPNYVESYPTKIFEYMALGMPVVTSNFPLYRSVVEVHRCGICVDPTNSSEIADAIQLLFEHPDERRHMGDNGKEASKAHYNWQNEATKLLEFYKTQVLAER